MVEVWDQIEFSPRRLFTVFLLVSEAQTYPGARRRYKNDKKILLHSVAALSCLRGAINHNCVWIIRMQGLKLNAAINSYYWPSINRSECLHASGIITES